MRLPSMNIVTSVLRKDIYCIVLYSAIFTCVSIKWCTMLIYSPHTRILSADPSDAGGVRYVSVRR